MTRSALCVLIAATLLAACGDDEKGSSITLDASGTDGNFVAGVDGNSGQFSIDAPGFSGRISLPKIKLDESSFRLNGVKLYPGSTIGGMNIDARDEDKNGKGGGVRVTFDSPADPTTVRDYFADKLGKADFKLKVDGSGLSGTDDEGRPFRLELAPLEGGKARGVITAGH